MLVLIGNLSLLISIFHSIINLLNETKTIKYIHIFTVFSFLILILLNINTDISVLNVIEYSNSKEPLLYKISGTWGNHEGSFLLWCTVLTSYSFMLEYFLKKIDLNILKQTLQIQLYFLFFFFCYSFFTSNPFLITYFQHIDGFPLNPILQDIVLSIHPPCLYIGYVGFSVIFSLGFILIKLNKVNFIYNIVGLYKFKIDYYYKSNLRLIYLYIQFFLSFCWSFLTFGILLGSWWSYYELGWGGWWFWDPVENASLLPWLIGLGLIHIFLLNLADVSIKNWVIFLSLFSFLLTVIGLFIVRSGFLESVHSFASDQSRGYWLLTFVIILFFVFLYGIVNIFFKKSDEIVIYKVFFNKNITKDVILLNNLFLIVFCIVILLITLLPLFLKILNLQERSFGPSFFNELLVPLFFPFFLLMVLSFNFKALKKKIFIYNFLKPSFLFSFVTSLLIIFLFFYKYGSVISMEEILPWFFILLSIFGILYLFYNNIIYTVKNYISVLSHFSIYLFVIGATSSSYFFLEQTGVMVPGDIQVFNNGLVCVFRNLNQLENLSYHSVFGDFLITSQSNISDNYLDNVKGILFPERRFYYINEFFSTKSSIYTNNFYDIVVILGEGSYNLGWFVQISIKPFLSFIWFGGFLLVISSFLMYLKLLKIIKYIS